MQSHLLLDQLDFTVQDRINYYQQHTTNQPKEAEELAIKDVRHNLKAMGYDEQTIEEAINSI